MSLINCKECGKEISSSAKKCPHCGVRRTSSLTMGCLIIIVLLVVLPIIGKGLFNVLNGAGLLKEYHVEEVETKSAPEKISKTKTVSAAKDKRALELRKKVGEKITIHTFRNNAKLCPQIDCGPGSEILRIPHGTKLRVDEVKMTEMPLWAFYWYKVKYQGKEGWVSELYTIDAPKVIPYSGLTSN